MCRLFELFYLFGVYQESARCGSPNNGCQHKCTNGVCSCNAGYNLVGSKQCVAKDCGAIKLTYCASGLYTWIVYHIIPYHTILYYTMLPCHTRPYMIISNHVCKLQHTETEQMNFRKTSFEEILSYFKLINGWLNSKLCAKRKTLHSDENAYVFFVKKETLKFVIEL